MPWASAASTISTRCCGVGRSRRTGWPERSGPGRAVAKVGASFMTDTRHESAARGLALPPGLGYPPRHRTGGRVVEGARLESAYTSKAYRGFESHPVRQMIVRLPRIILPSFRMVSFGLP